MSDSIPGNQPPLSPERRADISQRLRRIRHWPGSLLLLALCAGCGGQEQPFRKQTTGVTGQVFVDGVPVPASDPLKVECINVDGMDKEHPTVSSCLTGENGEFQISTYESGDGVPAGNYALTFFWGKMNLISNSYGGPDRLNGNYDDVSKSPTKFTVKQGEPVELGKIELSSKKADGN